MKTRKCPECQKEILYSSERECRRAEERQSKCGSCARKSSGAGRKPQYPKLERWVRTCPKCGCEIEYKRGDQMRASEKRGKKCKSCAITESCESRDMTGENNSFYGKKHTKETKEHLSKSKKGRSSNLSIEGRKRLVEFGRSKPHLPLQEVWLIKYGPEGAIAREKLWLERLSQSKTGDKNHRFGKEANQSSSRGWSGWFNGVFFRSLQELSFIIKVLEPSGLKWETGEQEKYRISYQFNGINRTYGPDFIIDGKTVVECKLDIHRNLPRNLAKEQAAIKWCEERGMEYVILEQESLPWSEIIQLHDSGIIRFIEKREKQFIKIKEKELRRTERLKGIDKIKENKTDIQY